MKNVGYVLVLLFASLAVVLSGCWDKVELEDREFVNAIGIDINTDEGDNQYNPDERFKVTLSIASLDAIQGKDGGGEEESKNKSVKTGYGRSVTEALRIIDSYSSQKIFLGHTKLIVLGKDVIKDEDAIKIITDTFERNLDMSRKMIVMTTDTEASKIISSKPVGEPLPGIFVHKFYETNGDSNAFTFKMDLELLMRKLRSTGTTIIPKITQNDKLLHIGGGAILKDFKFRGWIDESYLKGYLLYKGDAKDTPIVVTPGGIVTTCTILTHEKDISFSEIDNQIVCSINVKADMNIEEHYYGKDVYDVNTIKEIQDLLAKEIKNEILYNIELTQKHYKADVADFKSELRKKSFLIYQKHSSDWDKAFEEMQFNCNVDVSVRNIGEIM